MFALMSCAEKVLYRSCGIPVREDGAGRSQRPMARGDRAADIKLALSDVCYTCYMGRSATGQSSKYSGEMNI